MSRSQLSKALLLGGWALFVASLFLPAWQYGEAEPNFVPKMPPESSEWMGMALLYYCFPAWIPNAFIALTPSAFLFSSSHARKRLRIAAIGFFAAAASMMAVVLFVHGPRPEYNSPLIGAGLWIASYGLVALGHFVRERD